MIRTRMQCETRMTRIRASLTRRRSPIDFFIRLNKRLWERFPSNLRDSKLLRSYGMMLNKLVRRHASRTMFAGTFFFRNRPELELMLRLAGQKPDGSILDMTVLGCSIGAEVYSILSTIRAGRPDMDVRMCAVDYSAEVLNVAREGVYTERICEFVGESIFERMTDTEFAEMFEGSRREARVKSWIRRGVTWYLYDAGDSALAQILGPQDFVVASNFLCHMEAPEAERCLRNMARVVKRGGYLFVTGVDLDVRAKVAHELGWRPVSELIEEIHEGDPSVRRDWPCAWWGLEPLDKKRADWQMRYAAVFRLNEDD